MGQKRASLGVSLNLIGYQIGKLRIVDRLAQGGMGEVYVAYDEELERKVAVKAISDLQRLDETAQGRFEREAKTLSQIEHPNICRLYDFVHHEEGDFIILELVQGETLTNLVKSAPSDAAKIRIAIQIAEALQAAHGMNIVHRDLKPDNVMIDREGQVKILDFGLAFSVVDAHANTETMDVSDDSSDELPSGLFKTKHGQIMGTPMFMSPEQARGDRVTVASDMYSLGLLLHWMFSEELPYEPELSRAQLLWHAMQAQSKPVRGVDRDLTRLIEDLKDSKPSLRPRASDALYRLRWIGEKPKRRRRAQLLTVAIASLTLGLLVSSIALFSAKRERDAARKAASESEATRAFLHEVFTAAKPRSEGREVRVVDALEFAEQTIDQTESEPLVAASIHHTFADIYSALGVYDRAREHIEKALKVRESMLGQRHQAWIESRVLNSQILVLEGDFSGALAMLESLLSKTIDDDQVRLEAQRIHGEALLNLGRYDEAEAVFSAIIDSMENTPAEDPLFVPNLWQERASVHFYQGKLDEAESGYREALRLMGREVGSDHPDALTVQTNLAGVLAGQGKLDEVAGLLDELIPAAERVFGLRHPETLSYVTNRVVLAVNMRDFSRAEELAPGLLQSYRESLGDDHPRTIKAAFVLGSVYEYKGDYAQAQAHYREVLAQQRNVLGGDHPDVLQTMSHYSRVLKGLGELSDARAMNQQVIAVASRSLGVHHPSTLRARLDQIALSIALVDWRTAYQQLTDLDSEWSDFSEAGPLERALLQQLFGRYHVAQEAWEQAAGYFEQVAETKFDRLGASHPDTLDAQFEWAGVLERLGDIEGADELYRRAAAHGHLRSKQSLAGRGL